MLALHVLLLPPSASLLFPPLFLKTFPPFPSQCLLSIKASIPPCSHLNPPSPDGVRTLLLVPLQASSGRRNRKGRRCCLPSTQWLTERTECDPHCIAAFFFFDDLFIAWQTVSCKKAVVGRPEEKLSCVGRLLDHHLSFSLLQLSN